MITSGYDISLFLTIHFSGGIATAHVAGCVSYPQQTAERSLLICSFVKALHPIVHQ